MTTELPTLGELLTWSLLRVRRSVVAKPEVYVCCVGIGQKFPGQGHSGRREAIVAVQKVEGNIVGLVVQPMPR